MSTKRIEEALDLLGRTRVNDLGMVAELLPAARAELEAIRKAARNLMTPQSPKEKAHALMGRIAKESMK